jgi:hypothetical protein
VVWEEGGRDTSCCPCHGFGMSQNDFQDDYILIKSYALKEVKYEIRKRRNLDSFNRNKHNP